MIGLLPLVLYLFKSELFNNLIIISVMAKDKLIKSIKDIFNQEFVSNLLSTAFYGNSTMRMCRMSTNPQSLKAAKAKYDCTEDINAHILLCNGVINIEDYNDCDDDGYPRVRELNLDKLIYGFTLCMFNSPSSYASIMEGEDDMYDDLKVIQYALFGKIIYA